MRGKEDKKLAKVREKIDRERREERYRDFLRSKGKNPTLVIARQKKAVGASTREVEEGSSQAKLGTDG